MNRKNIFILCCIAILLSIFAAPFVWSCFYPDSLILAETGYINVYNGKLRLTKHIYYGCWSEREIETDSSKLLNDEADAAVQMPDPWLLIGIRSLNPVHKSNHDSTGIISYGVCLGMLDYAMKENGLDEVERKKFWKEFMLKLQNFKAENPNCSTREMLVKFTDIFMEYGHRYPLKPVKATE